MRKPRKEYQREYRKRNPGKSAAYTKKWRDSNKERTQKLARERARADIAKLKAELILAYGGICICCGESIPEFLTLDHMIPGDGAAHREQFRTSHKIYKHLKKLEWPTEGYRLLCFNCNCAIGAFGYCPHQRRV